MEISTHEKLRQHPGNYHKVLETLIHVIIFSNECNTLYAMLQLKSNSRNPIISEPESFQKILKI